MRTGLFLLLAFGSIGCSDAQQVSETRQWSITLKIVDETDQSVPNAQVAVSYLLPTPVGEELRSGRVSGLTDTNGVFSATHQDRTSGLGIHVEKKAYYPSFVSYQFGYPPRMEATNIPLQTMRLKSVRNPVPMFAKSVNLGLPVFDKQAGFDFEKGDWVAPYGNGLNADILFLGSRQKRSDSDSDYRLVVSFPNPGDGLQEFWVSTNSPPLDGSALRSSHEAPSTSYVHQWVQTRTVRPLAGYSGNRDENRNFYFRVRTVLDEKGNVRSAHYGKIYGDFMQFSYYLNPAPNDRNVEFDPKRNMLKGLMPPEQVSAP